MTIFSSSKWPKAKEFQDLVVSAGFVGFFEKPIQLKGGAFSNLYVNWRTPSSDAYMLDKITDYIIDFIKFNGLNPESIYGVPDGATKWGVITQFKWARSRNDYGPGKYPLPQGRSRPKEYGMEQDRLFVGAPRGPTVIIEDVTVEGASLLNVIDKLQSLGVPVIAAITLTDRNEKAANGKSVKAAIEERGVKYFAMSNALDFVPEAYKLQKPSKEVAEAIMKEYRERGTSRLKLLRK